MDRPDNPADAARLKAEAMQALREGRFDLADDLLARGDVTLAELTHNLRVYQAELEAQAQELRESNERLEGVTRQFRRLFEALPQPALVVDPLGVIVRRNVAAELLFGIDAESQLKPALRRLAADATARYAIHAALAEAHEHGRSRASGVALLDRQQGAHRVDLFLERVEEHGREGGERHLVLIVDETERVAAAERLASTNLALRQQQRENRALAAVARSTNAMVVMTDTQRRITWVNRAFEQISGWQADEVIGRTPRMLQGPGTDEATLARMRLHLERGEGFSGVEVLNYTKTGKPYWLLLDVQPVHSQEGPLEGFVSVQIDVTERRMAEQRLRDAEAYQRAVLDSAPGLVATVRADGTIGTLNAAGLELLQLGSTTEALGRPFADFLSAADAAAFARLHAAALMGESRTLRVTLLGAEGHALALELRTGSLWRAGSVQTVVLIGRDVSAEQALAAVRAEKEAALAASQAKTRFLSQMSHELRTPLNAVLGFTQLMLADLDGSALDAPTMRSRLDFVEQAGWHLLSMIDDVLDLSRIESGRVDLHVETVDVAAAVREAITMVQSAADKRRVHLAIESDGVAPCALADPVRLRQVLANLLSNAVKYNRDDGSVDVAVRTEGDRVLVAVRDSGRGLGPEQLAHLFEPFNRLGAPTNIEGTGIGLVIARHLAELMAGSLEAASTEGVGSTFTLRLPAASPRTEPAPVGVGAPPDADPAELRLRRPCRVLYIEDVESNIDLMRHALDGTAWTLQVARNGSDGLVVARAGRPDLILLDLQLPDIDGAEVRRRLLEDAATAAIPCVAVTADVVARQSDPPSVAFDGWLAKPLRIAEMRQVMADAVQGS